MKRIAALFLFTALVACDSDSTGPVDETPPDAPGFTATLSGDINGTWSGIPFFAIEPDPDIPSQNIWGIYLDTGDGTALSDGLVFVGVVDGTEGFPAAAPYTLLDASLGEEPGDGEQFAAVWQPTSATSVNFYPSTGGTLTLTESTPTRVRGTFTFQAARVTGIGTGSPSVVTVNVTGAFTAEPGAFRPPPS